MNKFLENKRNIAYVILCHDEPKILRHVAKILDFGHDKIFVHVDKKTEIIPFIDATHDLNNVVLIKNRVDIYWGGFSSIIATMNLFEEVLKDNIYFDRIVLLQGKDYPLHSPQYLHKFFDDRADEEFCKAKNISKSNDPKEYMKCHGFWVMDGKKTIIQRFFARFFNHLMNTKLKKKYRKGYFKVKRERWDVYKGWAQVSLTHSCVEYVLDVYHNMPKFNRYMKHRFPPDEIYIHTILHNSPFKNKISAYELLPREGATWFDSLLNLTYFEYPTNILVFSQPNDYEKLLETEALFFRKVTYAESLKLIEYIDERI